MTATIPDISTPVQSERKSLSADSEVLRAARAVALLAERAQPIPGALDVPQLLEMLGLSDTVREDFLRRHGAAPAAGRDVDAFGLCGKGLHRMSPDNIRLRSDGGRSCRRCARDGENRRRARERGEAAPSPQPAPEIAAETDSEPSTARLCPAGLHRMTPDNVSARSCRQCRNARRRENRPSRAKGATA